MINEEICKVAIVGAGWRGNIYVRSRMCLVFRSRAYIAGQRKMEIVESHPWETQFKPGLQLQAEKAVPAARGEANDLPTLQNVMGYIRPVRAIFGL